MRKSISKRVKITKTGKIRRRVMGISHAKSAKNNKQTGRKKGERGLYLPTRVLNKRIQ